MSTSLVTNTMDVHPIDYQNKQQTILLVQQFMGAQSMAEDDFTARDSMNAAYHKGS